MDRNIATPALSRRQFIVTTLTAAGGFAVGIGPAAWRCRSRRSPGVPRRQIRTR